MKLISLWNTWLANICPNNSKRLQKQRQESFRSFSMKVMTLPPNDWCHYCRTYYSAENITYQIFTDGNKRAVCKDCLKDYDLFVKEQSDLCPYCGSKYSEKNPETEYLSPDYPDRDGLYCLSCVEDFTSWDTYV